jgi:hypothetical protein
MQMKKPAWASMPVLDVRVLDANQLKFLADTYDTLSIKELAPIAQLNNDPIRQAIDAALCRALDLPDLSKVRELLAREPGLTAKDINPQSKSVADIGKLTRKPKGSTKPAIAGTVQVGRKAAKGEKKPSLI